MAKIHKSAKICPICCDDINDDGIILHKTRRQTHKLCVKCGILYLTPFVNQALKNLRQNIRNKINIIRCPGTYHSSLRNQCTKNIDICKITLSSTEKIESTFINNIINIQYILASPYRYLCPNKDCNKIIEVHPEDPILHTECIHCFYNWCRECQTIPYHEGMSCLEYEVKEYKTKNGKYIHKKIEKGDMKYCPQCKAITEKTRDLEGHFVACNKMICENCNIKWCWLCQEIDIDYDHYNINNPTSCTNKLWYGTNI